MGLPGVPGLPVSVGVRLPSPSMGMIDLRWALHLSGKTNPDYCAVQNIADFFRNTPPLVTSALCRGPAAL